MRNGIPLLTVPVTSTGTITANRFVSTSSAVVASAGVNTYGVAQMDAASGEVAPVTVLGTEIVESGAAIAAGAAVQTDASGRAITLAAGVNAGRLAPGESASAAGQFVEVILNSN